MNKDSHRTATTAATVEELRRALNSLFDSAEYLEAQHSADGDASDSSASKAALSAALDELERLRRAASLVADDPAYSHLKPETINAVWLVIGMEVSP